MSEVAVTVVDDDRLATDAHAALQAAAQATVVYCGLADEQPAELTLLLTDDDQLQQLNAQFRDIDAPTDVLSFGADEEEALWQSDVRYLGDIAVSVPYATRQAQRRGHAPIAELVLLVVHGVLHLLGHDHADSAEKARMWQAQRAILKQLHVVIDTFSDDELP